MITYAIYAAAAFYLGLLTSISPCPLATNIAAISYIGRKVESPRMVIAAGVLYMLGRCILYLGSSDIGRALVGLSHGWSRQAFQIIGQFIDCFQIIHDFRVPVS